ncbi:hypothetical protein [Klebsiella quasipneumoniae]|uniref:hypothetical protein n=1 Tax=Klebsiella quasipneumoniae TaxID=1463165 RepID=UPI0011B7B8EE|nr:hypothetical protein [Klebsiella quasipneumoniae]TWV32293.1 hypothetical protein FRA07_00640 [Klebsiella quasipneumoniae subsp. similipneumoniae]HBY9388001.1 hypothetical protein [Klebsiella pneumoniae]
MIELHKNQLVISFPEVHPKASGAVSFQRTLRVPDNDRIYPLPAGLGKFQLTHIDNYAEKIPACMLKKGGVLMPIYNSEAMWINFSSDYPIAMKIATGKINAITGLSWQNELSHHPQDFIDLSRQYWLDGFNVGQGTVRQFTSVPLQSGYTVEEQITGSAEVGGLQIIAWPMKASVYDAIQRAKREREEREAKRKKRCKSYLEPEYNDLYCLMGMGAGGRITQKIKEDIYGPAAWDTNHSSRCFIHMINASDWHKLTGYPMPRPPITSRDYKNNKLPWFKYYEENTKGLTGSVILNKIKSIRFLSGKKQRENVFTNEDDTILIHQSDKAVRNGKF